MSDLSVKVGVRIRPLLSKERHQSNSLSNYDSESIEFKNQTFTYDNVFGLELSQQELYQNTAAPMLKSFLDGFNVTIIAYGKFKYIIASIIITPTLCQSFTHRCLFM
jgi:hypothetical protein